MAQYFPTYKANNFDEINRKLTPEELEKIKKYLELINLENGYIQELEDNEIKYVPKFSKR